jgi:DHA1 family bicyclomycin/chloramphenicol resistance-like MFS transporter
LILGITGGAGIVISRAIAADIVKGAEAARFFSLLMSISMLAPLVGPLIGGVLLDMTDTWRSAFFFLAIFCALLAAAIVLFVPETLPVERRHAGGYSQLGKGALALMRDRIFVGYAITQVFAFGALFAYLASSSFIFQEQFGLSATQYSFAFSGLAGSIVIMGFVNRRLVVTLDVRKVLVWSLAIAAVGAIALIPIMGADQPSMWLMILMLLLVIATRATIGANSMALGLARSALMGTASAILGALTFAGALVVAPMLALMPYDTGLTMAVVMALCSVLAWASTTFLSQEKSA